MNQQNKCKPVKINLNVSDQLTTTSCGHIVVEIMKFIAYQRLQIPYNYQWLKQIVTRRKAREDKLVKEGLQSEKHFRTASSALANFDFILKSLLQEISSPLMPEEICITLGATPVTCKEVYRLILPQACHKPQCHSTTIAKDQKLQSNVFRMLATSEDLNQAFSNIIPPTNMHVFIKKKVSNHIDILNMDNFVPASGSRIPRSSRVVVIDFRNSDSIMTCCNDFQIFGDNLNSSVENVSSDNDSDFNEIQSTDSMKWYQSTYIMKGFKDCLVNGSSVTNSW